MDFDPSSLNFGAAQKLPPRAESSHIAVLERQARQAEHRDTPPVAHQLRAQVEQHQLQRRVARLQQMQQAIASEASAHRLMQALALVKTLYTAEDAPTDLASISLLQPILQGLQPKWAALKAQAQSAPVLAVDYQRLDKLKQPHTRLHTAERSALFKLLHTVYKAIEALYGSQPQRAEVKSLSAQDLGLRSQLHRASSEREKQRLQAEIAELQTAQQRDYHAQCVHALRQCQMHMAQVASFAETPRPRLLQQLAKLAHQWENNKCPEAAYPLVPELLQGAGRQLARIGVADADAFIQTHNLGVQERLQGLGSEHALFTLLQTWQGTFAEALTRLLVSQHAAQASQALSLARTQSQQLQAQLEKWPAHHADIQALEHRFLTLDPTSGAAAEIRTALLQHYGQVLLNLPKIGE